MRGIARCAFLLLVSLTCVNAQTTNASLTGRVTDPAKALVDDAKVAAICEATGVRYETATNSSGEYHLANLLPDSYRIEIEKAGFKKLLKPNVILHVQDALKVDVEMTLGDVSETVTVEAGVPLVNLASAVVSTVIDRRFVENLPLNGRSFQTLIMLTPGVVVTATRFDDQGQFSINGQRADANYFSVDGVSANFGVTGLLQMNQTASGALPALSASGGTNSLVSVDAMQEFRVQTSSFAPEFGRTPGGQVSIVTRSGTNALHGTVFEYFRNNVLDARDWFVNANNLAKPQQRQNDFGGVVGGPILKNKTFFFFSYEGLRLRQPSTQQSVVPDNASRQSAPSAMRPYLNAFPIANSASLGGGLAQFNASYSNPSTLNAYSVRIDQVVNSKVSLFGRDNFSPSSLDQRSPPQAGAILSMNSSLSSSVHTFTVGFTHLITSRISNEMRANYSNHRIGTRFFLDAFGGAVPVTDSLLFPTGASSANGLFSMFIAGIGQYNQGNSGTSEQRQINLIDNLSITKRNHEMKFGVDYRWLAPFSRPFNYRQFVQFSGMSTTPGGALSGKASLAGTFNMQGDSLLSQNFSTYGQDTWRITPRFTLTYGLRWDVNPAIRGKDAANDPFTLIGLNNPAALTLAPRGTPLYKTTFGNLAPRIGIAYQLGGIRNWGAAIRAGFGIFYDLGQGSLGGVSSFFPYGATKIISPAPVPFPLSAQDAAPPATTVNPPVVTILVADPHLKLPRTYQWNLALEQSIGSNQVLSLTYVGAIGRDLLRTTKLFNVNPNNFDRGNSDFDIRHSFTMGLTYDLPFRGSQEILKAVTSGWSLDSFVFARSAPTVDIVGASFSANGVRLDARPNVVPGVPRELFGSQYPGGKIFNRAAFTAAPTGTQGNFGRNVLRGFGAWQADVGLQRQFQLTDKIGLRFRSEFFNIFNHPNFGNPVSLLTSQLFGRSTQTLANSLGSGGANGGFNPLYQIGGPRSIQFALKLQF